MKTKVAKRAADLGAAHRTQFTDNWLGRVQLKPGTSVREVEAFEEGNRASACASAPTAARPYSSNGRERA